MIYVQVKILLRVIIFTKFYFGFIYFLMLQLLQKAFIGDWWSCYIEMTAKKLLLLLLSEDASSYVTFF
jgi:hypothetical protein